MSSSYNLVLTSELLTPASAACTAGLQWPQLNSVSYCYWWGCETFIFADCFSSRCVCLVAIDCRWRHRLTAIVPYKHHNIINTLNPLVSYLLCLLYMQAYSTSM